MPTASLGERWVLKMSKLDRFKDMDMTKHFSFSDIFLFLSISSLSLSLSLSLHLSLPLSLSLGSFPFPISTHSPHTPSALERRVPPSPSPSLLLSLTFYSETKDSKWFREWLGFIPLPKLIVVSWGRAWDIKPAVSQLGIFGPCRRWDLECSGCCSALKRDGTERR